MKAKTDTGKNPARHATPAADPAGAEELMDMEGAILHLKTTRPTFYRWLRSGKLKGMKVGRQWRFYRADLDRFLKGEGPQIELAADIRPLQRALLQRLHELGAPDDPAEAVPETGTASEKVVAVVSAMIRLAHHLKASDIHFHQRHAPPPAVGMNGVLQFRVDGVLQTFAGIDGRLAPPILDQLKTMAGCDLHERSRPQDGRIKLSIGGQTLDLRVCFVPAVTGEAVTIRLLDAKAAALDLDGIPFAPADRARLDRAMAAPCGLILFTGPTGSGKTTVEYACINTLAKTPRKILTVEDPVEYILENTVQIPVNPAVGLTFAAGLRAILRCDPDVIMAGEIRDRETLQILLQCALTGHLAISSLHTEDAAAALQRLLDIGGEPFLVADAVRLIVSQRLVRRLCAACSRPETPAREELAKAAAVARQGGLDWGAMAHQFRHPVGCPQCGMTGYRGRTPIAEVLEMTPELDRAIRTGAGPDHLRRLAIEQGMTTLAADGIRRCAAGETTLNEVFRVIREPRAG